MSIWEQISAFAALGQFVVIAVAALFAYLQLRGLRRQQEAELIQHIFEQLNAEELASALDFVYDTLPQKLTEAQYVREIFQGRASAKTHPELAAMHFFNALGLLVHSRMVGERTIVPIVASPCMRVWERVAPVVELMRRRYPHAYTPFESLVVRSRALDLSIINARFRQATPGLRTQWEGTARDLTDRRIGILDENAPDTELVR